MGLKAIFPILTQHDDEARNNTAVSYNLYTARASTSCAVQYVAPTRLKEENVMNDVLFCLAYDVVLLTITP